MSEGDYEIMLEAEVGERLERMAAARGVSARDLVTAMIDLSDAQTLDAAGHDDVATLEALQRQWAAVETGSEPVVAHSDVREWLSTWGTSEFKSWPSSRR